jgi:hypothetical protein
MAVKLICTTCGRRDLATTDDTAAMRGWRVTPDRSICPKCATLEPTDENDDAPGVEIEGAA